MIRCAILTSWTKEDYEGMVSNIPEVFLNYTLRDGSSFRDITHQEAEADVFLFPDPNMYVLEALLTQDLYDEIAADSKYFILTEEVL